MLLRFKFHPVGILFEILSITLPTNLRQAGWVGLRTEYTLVPSIVETNMKLFTHQVGVLDIPSRFALTERGNFK